MRKRQDIKPGFFTPSLTHTPNTTEQNLLRLETIGKGVFCCAFILSAGYGLFSAATMHSADTPAEKKAKMNICGLTLIGVVKVVRGYINFNVNSLIKKIDASDEAQKNQAENACSSICISSGASEHKEPSEKNIIASKAI